jgi:hypothetical protein
MTTAPQHCGTCRHVIESDRHPPPPRDVVPGRGYVAGCSHPDHLSGPSKHIIQHAERPELPVCSGYEAAA